MPDYLSILKIAYLAPIELSIYFIQSATFIRKGVVLTFTKHNMKM